MKIRSLFLILVIFLVITGCSQDMTLLERIKNDGKLVVVTRNSATTYYQGPFGYTGLEYDLASLFAEQLGVKLEIVVEDNFGKMFDMLDSGKADLAASNLSITDARKQRLAFGPSYMEVVSQVAYRLRNNKKRPRRITDLIDKDIEVAANSSHVEILTKLK